MKYSFAQHDARSRTALAIAALVVMSLVLPSDITASRANAATTSSATATQDSQTWIKVTGAGTVFVTPPAGIVASFSVKARRPAAFPNGEAHGRIHYVKHANVPNRKVNAPVTFMQAESTPRPPENDRGGKATLVGDCHQPGAECPSQTDYVLVYVEDNSDRGKNNDVFEIFYCSGTPGLPGATFPGTVPFLCSGPEGGPLRSGNIQIRFHEAEDD
jgi:hypothetical protein